MKFKPSPEEGDRNPSQPASISHIKYFSSRQIRQLNHKFTQKLQQRETDCGECFIDIELGKPSVPTANKLEQIKLLRNKFHLNKVFINKHHLTNTNQLDQIIKNLDGIIRSADGPVEDSAPNLNTPKKPENTPNTSFIQQIIDKIKGYFKR